MNIKNIFAIPVALVADIITLGNMGEKSFTQQVFDRDREETLVKILRKCK